jgi:hypothetical protein
MTMKRIFLVLLISVAVGACGESSTDVVSRRGGSPGGGEFIPPDTLIKTENATFHVYKPGNIVALESVLSLTARTPFHDAIESAGSFGYGFDPADVAVATGRLDDGREVLVALGSLEGIKRDGYLFYLRVGDREHTFPLRETGGGKAGFDLLEVAAKGEIGPRNMPWYFGDLLDCLIRAMADLLMCQPDCADCYRNCVFDTLVRLVVCVQFTMF